MYCNKCNYSYCNCSTAVTQRTTIISDQAGREGEGIKQILIKTGRLPSNATDNDVIEYMKGDSGQDGVDGQQEYENTEW